MSEKIWIKVEFVVETTPRKAKRMLKLERDRYSKNPSISDVLDDGTEELLSAEEAIENELDAYTEVLFHAIPEECGCVVSTTTCEVEPDGDFSYRQKADSRF